MVPMGLEIVSFVCVFFGGVGGGRAAAHHELGKRTMQQSDNRRHQTCKDGIAAQTTFEA